MSHDDIDHIPSIIPKRDSDHHRPSPKGRSKPAAKAGRKPGAPPPVRSNSAGAGVWSRVFITVSLVVAAVACAWAWQLQGTLQRSGELMSQYEQRISDLEDRLSDTDEGLSQNTATMAVKIKELYSEVDKLWAARNVQKKDIASLQSKSATNSKSIASAQSQMKSAASDLAKLKNVAGDLQRLMSSAKSNQSEVERVADSLNRMNLEFAKLGKRVQSNEEWVGSVNAFRRQVNTTLTQMQASIRNLEATP